MPDNNAKTPPTEATDPSSPEKQRKPPGLHEDERPPQVHRSGALPTTRDLEAEDEHQRGTD